MTGLDSTLFTWQVTDVHYFYMISVTVATVISIPCAGDADGENGGGRASDADGENEGEPWETEGEPWETEGVRGGDAEDKVDDNTGEEQRGIVQIGSPTNVCHT